jgi:hypothetical protein
MTRPHLIRSNHSYLSYTYLLNQTLVVLFQLDVSSLGFSANSNPTISITWMASYCLGSRSVKRPCTHIHYVILVFLSLFILQLTNSTRCQSSFCKLPRKIIFKSISKHYHIYPQKTNQPMTTRKEMLVHIYFSPTYKYPIHTHTVDLPHLLIVRWEAIYLPSNRDQDNPGLVQVLTILIVTNPIATRKINSSAQLLYLPTLIHCLFCRCNCHSTNSR